MVHPYSSYSTIIFVWSKYKKISKLYSKYIFLGVDRSEADFAKNCFPVTEIDISFINNWNHLKFKYVSLCQNDSSVWLQTIIKKRLHNFLFSVYEVSSRLSHAFDTLRVRAIFQPIEDLMKEHVWWHVWKKCRFSYGWSTKVHIRFALYATLRLLYSSRYMYSH